jgi:hypothetical protein
MPRSLVFSLLHSFWRDGIIEPPFAVREHRTRVVTVFIWSHYNRPHGTWRFKTPMYASNFLLSLMRKIISVVNNCIGEVQKRHLFFCGTSRSTELSLTLPCSSKISIFTMTFSVHGTRSRIFARLHFECMTYPLELQCDASTLITHLANFHVCWANDLGQT